MLSVSATPLASLRNLLDSAFTAIPPYRICDRQHSVQGALVRLLAQGWVAAPQQPLTCNEDLLLGEYRADFIPEATVAELSSSVSYVEGAGMVPDAGTLLAAGSRGNAPSSGSGAAGGASTAPKGADACGGAGSSGTAAAAARSGAIEAGTARSAEAAGVKEELLRAMRGMDPAQLRAYISGGARRTDTCSLVPSSSLTV